MQLSEQSLQNPFDVLADLLIGEANRGIPSQFVHLVATTVSNRIVRIAVNLDDQSLLRAVEIDDTITNYVLATELEPSKLRATDVTPKLGFERATIHAKMTGAVE
jgi:hypothetical protein